MCNHDSQYLTVECGTDLEFKNYSALTTVMMPNLIRLKTVVLTRRTPSKTLNLITPAFNSEGQLTIFLKFEFHRSVMHDAHYQHNAVPIILHQTIKIAAPIYLTTSYNHNKPK